jgi:ribose transport system ATP-binding protein
VPSPIGVENLTVQFPAVRALDDVTLHFGAGEVHGIIGENGAGKSSFMRVVAGLQRPTAGRLLIDGRPVHVSGAADAIRRGVGMIHQELNLVDELSVAENLFLGRFPGRLFLNRSTMRTRASELLASVGSEVDPSTRLGRLSIAQQQMVEIAKAVGQEARVLIMDEPTAVLGERESQKLFALIRRLREEGKTILYVSHRLPEVLELCDRITVLRDGKLVTTVAGATIRGTGVWTVRAQERTSNIEHRTSNVEGQSSETSTSMFDVRRSMFDVRSVAPSASTGLPSEPLTEGRLASLMVGRPMEKHFPPRRAHGEAVRFEVVGVSVPGQVADAGFQVRAGEIFGLAGLIGAGRTELAEAIVGLRRKSAGSVLVDGQPVSIRHVGDAKRAGIAYVSEDRKAAGLTLEMSIAANTTMATLRRYCHPFIDRKAEREVTIGHATNLRTKYGRVSDPVATLSGGNQQKVALAKWLDASPKVLLLDEPTRGVDIGAKEEIYRVIQRLADDGMACVVISSEMNELLGLCHRIGVMRQGRLAAILDGPTATEDQVMHAAAGVSAA